jgi:alpha-tubulin suppressor-like RCC1 family protein
VIGLAAGGDHTCALVSDGTVWCWGDNSTGALGDTDLVSFGPVKAAGLTQATGIAAGVDYTCAVLCSGAASCWGNPTFGSLATADPSQYATPQPVVGLMSAVSISANGYSTCTSNGAGELRCWGDPEFQYCSTVAHAFPPAPQIVAGVTKVGLFSTGVDLCVSLTGGTLSCRGPDYCVQTPDSGAADASLVHVPEWDNAVGLAPGCAVLTDGGITCAGKNDYGQVGDGTHADRKTPVPVVGVSSAVGVAVGGWHKCAWLKDGSAWCWGSNSLGQLGPTGFGSDQPTPVMVEGVAGVVAMALGSLHTCALVKDGSVWCWGDDTTGQLGRKTGSIEGKIPSPVQW